MSDTQQRQLPTLAQLYNEDSLALSENQNSLNVLLNEEPPTSWIKTHPIVKNLKYVAIDKIEYLLTKIFIQWHLEIKEVKVVANSIVTIVRLHYKDPVSGIMLFQDGVGACPLQVNQGARADDFGAIKSNAVQIGAPASESYAFKDAAEKIGKIFGKDLNRADTMSYESLLGKFDSVSDSQAKENARVMNYINSCKSIEELENAKDHLFTPQMEEAYNGRYNQLSK